MNERITSSKVCKNLVRRSLENFRLPYLTITPTFSICKKHGYINGEVSECPKCGEKTEIWTRVMGYLRPTSEFNKGKVSEYEERKLFKEEIAMKG